MTQFWKTQLLNIHTAAFTLKNAIPELSKTDSEKIISYLRKHNLSIVRKDLKKTPFYMRLTLPFALILMLSLLILLPFNYIITGSWYYKWKWLDKWFCAVGFA